MNLKRKIDRRSGALTATSKHFRRILYGAIGIVLSSYIVLFILVVSRHIDQSAQDQLKQSIIDSVEAKGPKGPRSRKAKMIGGLGPSVLGMESFHERWAAMARVLPVSEPHPAYPRRRIQLCTQPQFRSPPGPLVALASFPGSGNTWIRFLVQQATGYLTGSVYRDYSLKRNGFPGESIANGSVLLVKTHEWGEKTRQKFHKAVLLIRDPYGALIAEFNRRAGGHVGHASPDKFLKGNAWQNFAQSHAKIWMESILDWLQYNGPLLILRYEVMTSNLPEELIRLLKFLEVKVSWNVFHCVIRNRDGIFRRARKPLKFEPFDDSLKKVVDGYKAIVEVALRYYEQGVKFDINNVTLLQNNVEMADSGNSNSSGVLPLTYVEKEQTEAVS